MGFQSYPRDEKAIENDGNERSTYSLKQGTTILRVMPPYSNRGIWYKRIHEYYFRFGNTHIFMVSPRDSGEQDPIWDYADEVFASGDQAKIDIVRRWRPREVYLVNAFLLSEPDQKKPHENIIALKIPKKVQRALKTFDTDVSTGYGDITNLEKGFTVSINKVQTGSDAVNTEYQVMPHREQSNIFEELKKRGLDLNKMTLHNLDTVYPPKSFVEMTDILDTLRTQNRSTSQVESTVGTVGNVTVSGGTVTSEDFKLESLGIEAPPQD